MTTRRTALRRITALTMGGLAAAHASDAQHRPSAGGVGTDPSAWRMPDEAEPHARTWMAFGASREIWGARLLPEVQRNLAAIALAIARVEPVTMLVRPADLAAAKALVGSDVHLLESPIDDLWIRDTGPVFVTNGSGAKAGVDFNFNGWGGKQPHARDAGVARAVADAAGVQRLPSSLVLEGGGIEVDGSGGAIVTESCVLNANRNPRLTKAACVAELKRVLGLTSVLWLPGIRGRDITDGHTDFYARFAAPGVVVAAYDPDPRSFDHAVTTRHLEVLRAATDGRGRRLRVEVLDAPGTVRKEYGSAEFAAGYINFYVCNDAVIMPQFGDDHADGAARDTLSNLFPKRQIVPVNIDAIAAGGGGIHCATQQEPA